MTDAKILDRPVKGNVPRYAYACGHPAPMDANFSLLKCPECRTKDAQKVVK